MQNAGAVQHHGNTDLSKSRDLSGERMEVCGDAQVLHQNYLQHVTTASHWPNNSNTDKAGDTPAPKTMTAELLPVHKQPVKPATLRRKQQPQTVGLQCQCTSFNKRQDRYLHTQWD